MIYQVFLQHTTDNGYTAIPLLFPDCVAVGETREEALANLKVVLGARLAQGEIVGVEVGESAHPWLKGAGMFKEDATYDDFLAEIEAFRREIDEADTDRAEISP